MSWASSEIVSTLIFLLPGFVTAAIFYSLTSYPNPGAFDRVIHALVFTVIVQAIMGILTSLLNDSATKENTSWIETWGLPLSILIAILIAVILAYILNRDIVHSAFRRFGITKETSYPSEWYSAFSRHHGCYVVLHLEGERRLFGWPEEWPSCPDEGHFRIVQGEWLTEDKKRIPVTGVSAILIPVGQVEMVEFSNIRPDEKSEE